MQFIKIFAAKVFKLLFQIYHIRIQKYLKMTLEIKKLCQKFAVKVSVLWMLEYICAVLSFSHVLSLPPVVQLVIRTLNSKMG